MTNKGKVQGSRMNRNALVKYLYLFFELNILLGMNDGNAITVFDIGVIVIKNN